MNHLISAAEMRLCEERNFAAGTADALELMHIAGCSCADQLLKFMKSQPQCRRIVIFSGHGNNGGDGIVMASQLVKMQDLPVILVLAKPPETLSPGSSYYFKQLPGQVNVQSPLAVKLNRSDLIVDALLGTGCQAPMREPYRQLIELINQSHAAVLAVDIPSGLGSDLCVKANMTVTIGYFKDILFSDAGIQNCGRLRRVTLPLPLTAEIPENAPLVTDSKWLVKNSVKLPNNIHKYQRGKVLILGGSQKYVQAPFLSGRAALRNGAGLVELGVPFAASPGCGTLSLIVTQLPETDGFLNKNALETIAQNWQKTAVIAAGPGLGRTPDTVEFIRLLLQSHKPLVLDADALFCASQMPELLAQRSYTTILTPHRGEAAVLAAAFDLTLSGNDLQDARQLAKCCKAVVLLKGPRTVIADPAGNAFINSSGTPALATAGSGDVLTGMIAAELLRYPPLTAAARGAFLHGAAGEIAEQTWGACGVIADDLPEFSARARQQILP